MYCHKNMSGIKKLRFPTCAAWKRRVAAMTIEDIESARIGGGVCASPRSLEGRHFRYHYAFSTCFILL